jgi:ABC-2 type transport system permease protein
MSAVSTAARSGLTRGGIELRQTLTNVLDLWTYFFPAALLVGTVYFLRDAALPGTDLSLGARTLPSTLGMSLAFAGLLTVATLLVTDREDGTLLRAKATPNGMAGYLVGKLVLVGGMTAIGLVLQIGPSLFIVDGLRVDAAGWLTLCWLLPLGLAATIPLGAIFGSLGLWAVLGLVLAPVLLRRMARRESGSAVAERRAKALQRVG